MIISFKFLYLVLIHKQAQRKSVLISNQNQ